MIKILALNGEAGIKKFELLSCQVRVDEIVSTYQILKWKTGKTISLNSKLDISREGLKWGHETLNKGNARTPILPATRAYVRTPYAHAMRDSRNRRVAACCAAWTNVTI